jgi:hypothetical protein
MFNHQVFEDADKLASEADEQARQLLWMKLDEKAKTDAEFRKDLRADPARVVRQVAHDLGGAVADVVNRDPGLVKEVAEKAKELSAFIPLSLERVENLVFETIGDIRRSFRLTLLLSQVLFYAGLVMVCLAFLMGLNGKDQLLSAILGTGGILSSLLSTTVTSPMDRVRNAAGNLIQLQIAYLAYYKQLYLLGADAKSLTHEDAFAFARQISECAKALMGFVQLYVQGARREDRGPEAGAAAGVQQPQQGGDQPSGKRGTGEGQSKADHRTRGGRQRSASTGPAATANQTAKPTAAANQQAAANPAEQQA